MIRGVIFDLGNTIMYLEKDWREIDSIANQTLIRFLNEHGIPAGEDLVPLFRAAREDGWRLAEETAMEHTVAEALGNALAQLGLTSLDGVLTRAVDTFFGVGEAYQRTYPGTHEVLQALKAHRFRVGLVSNADDDGLVQRAVVNLGLAPYMDPVLSSAGLKRRKPDPHMFRHVANLWHLAPDQIVMVGDSPKYDIVGSHAAGMRSILIDRQEGHVWQQIPAERADDPLIKPDATIRSFDELLDTISKF